MSGGVGTVASESLKRGRGLRLQVPQRQRLLLLIDLAVVNLALLLGLHVTLGVSLSPATMAAHPSWFVTFSVLWLTIASAGDNYNGWRSVTPTVSLIGIGKALALTELLYLIVPGLTPPLPPSRLLLFARVGLTAFPLVLWRLLFAAVFAMPDLKRRAIIVGAGRAGRTIAKALGESEPSHVVVGFVDDDLALQETVVAGGKVLGRSADLGALLTAHGATDVVFAITRDVTAEVVREVLRCYERGVRIVPMPLLYEEVTGRIPVEHVGNRWLVTLPIDSDPLDLYRVVKRGMDVVASLVGLALLAPFFPLVALGIKLDSPGPVFYRPERLGQGGRPFRLFKLRTMVRDADGRGDPTFTRHGDDRITRLGWLLRAAHLDELPQFINILRGEMSLVGPRPERYVAELEERIPFYRTRLAVKPGTAGWALIKQGYAEGTEATLVKLQYDLYYIKHQSLYLDVLILVRTAVDMLFRRGR